MKFSEQTIINISVAFRALCQLRFNELYSVMNLRLIMKCVKHRIGYEIALNESQTRNHSVLRITAVAAMLNTKLLDRYLLLLIAFLISFY